MTKTTPLPPINVLDVLPELAAQTAVTIRLHPRRGNVEGVSKSKIGDTFLWPNDESWLMSLENPPMAYVPILQVNARDVPEFPFPEGKDLLQLLWLPSRIDRWLTHVFWRASEAIHSPLAVIPPSSGDRHFVPKPCILTFERVIEYPSLRELNENQVSRLEQASIGVDWEDGYSLLDEYFYNLSVCPGNKLGGHVFWIQDPQWPICEAGHRMEHLLTLTDFEVDSESWRRWLPKEDQKLWKDPSQQEALANAPGWWLGAGSIYYFVCRNCSDWPIKNIYQR